MPTSRIPHQSRRERKGSPGSRGGTFIWLSSGGSTPSASAGRPLVTRLIQRICSGESGGVSRKKEVAKTVMQSPALDDKRKKIAFLILLKIARPSRTASTIVAKL